MIKIAICDDEVQICAQLEEMIEKISYKHHIKCEVGIFYTGEGLCIYLEKENIFDLIFLDIELESLNGVEVGKLIRQKYGIEVTQIVYISSKERYALQLFSIRPLDFLIKPIRYENVVNVIMIVYEMIKKNESELFEYSFGKYVYKIPIKEIIYFESFNRKVHIHCIERNEICYAMLKDIVEKVNMFDFIWIHKSYLVNYMHVIKFEYEQVTLSSGMLLPIAQSKRKQVRSIILKH